MTVVGAAHRELPGYTLHGTTNKTATSRRPIDLDDQTLEVLRACRRSPPEGQPR